jgi:hypothetical protein
MQNRTRKLEIEIDDFVKNFRKNKKKYLPLLKVMKRDDLHSVKCHS